MTNLDRWAEKWEKIEGSEILQTNGEIEKKLPDFSGARSGIKLF